MELFDLYDKDRKHLGITMIRGDKQPENTYRIVVHTIIFNSNNQMLIQRRQASKKDWGGMWDLSCGGSTISGENSQEAASRELKEELGIDIDYSESRPVLTLHFDNGFNDFYIINGDYELNELTLQEEEVAEVKWATKDEIDELVNAGEFIPYHEDFIGLLFFLKDKRTTFKSFKNK